MTVNLHDGLIRPCLQRYLTQDKSLMSISWWKICSLPSWRFKSEVTLLDEDFMTVNLDNASWCISLASCSSNIPMLFFNFESLFSKFLLFAYWQVAQKFLVHTHSWKWHEPVWLYTSSNRLYPCPFVIIGVTYSRHSRMMYNCWIYTTMALTTSLIICSWICSSRNTWMSTHSWATILCYLNNLQFIVKTLNFRSTLYLVHDIP